MPDEDRNTAAEAVLASWCTYWGETGTKAVQEYTPDSGRLYSMLYDAYLAGAQEGLRAAAEIDRTLKP